MKAVDVSWMTCASLYKLTGIHLFLPRCTRREVFIQVTTEHPAGLLCFHREGTVQYTAVVLE